MNRILVNWLIIVIAVVIASRLLPGIVYTGFKELAIFALVLGLLNAVVSPIIKIFTFPITLVTLGLFTFVINALMFWLAASIVHFGAFGFGTAFVAALIVSVVNLVLSRFL